MDQPITRPPRRPSWQPPARAEDPKLVLARRLKQVGGDNTAVDYVMRYAALSSTFAPEEALIAAGLTPEMAAQPDTDAALVRFHTVAQLVQACDTVIWQPKWIMRATARGRLIESLKAEDLPDVVGWRRTQPGFETDSAAQVICAALLGEDAFAPDAVKGALVGGRLNVADCETLIRGISLALPHAPARDHLDALRATLARIEAEAAAARSGQMAERAEATAIKALIEAQWAGSAERDTLGIAYVGGREGVGKSILLTQVRDAYDDAQTIRATLDFNRPGIEGGDPLGLALELARQCAESAGPQGGALYAAINSALAALNVPRTNSRVVAQDLLGTVARLLDDGGKRLLLSLDSLEALTLYGDMAALLLLESLQELRRQVGKLAMLGAGRELPRADVPDLAPDLLPHVDIVMLRGLPDPAAIALLGQLGLEGAAADRVAAFARGRPLLLHLAARLVHDGGEDALAGFDADETRDPLARELLQALIARLDPALRPVATAGLLLRQIDAALLAQIAPLTVPDAQRVLDQLTDRLWLTARQDDWLVHQDEMRAALFEQLIAEDPARARTLFAQAADWHGARPGEAPLALYYRLQGARWDGVIDPIDPNVAAHLTPAMIGELPEPARNHLALARGERSALFRDPRVKTADASTVFGPDAVAELQMLLERRARAEAAMMIGRASDLSGIDPISAAGATVIEALWRGGDIARAAPLLAARRKAGGKFDLGETGFLIAAFADIDPLGFRKYVRDNDAWAEALGAALGKTVDPDWDIAALLLRAEGIATEQSFADALWTLWADGPPDPERLALLRDRLHRAAALPHAQGPVHIPALAALLARAPTHREMLLCRLQNSAIADPAPLAVEIARGLDGAQTAAEAANYHGCIAVERLDMLGGVAFLALRGVRAKLAPDLEALALCAARRRAAVAGHWAYGAVPKGWPQPPANGGTAASPFERRGLQALIRTIPAHMPPPARPETDVDTDPPPPSA